MQNKWLLAVVGAFLASFLAVMPLAFLGAAFSSQLTVRNFLSMSFFMSPYLFPFALIIFSPLAWSKKIKLIGLAILSLILIFCGYIFFPLTF